MEQTLNDKALVQSANEAADKYNPRFDLEAFVKETGRRFIQNKLDQFPMICDITRVQNKIAMDEDFKYGKKGKYTDSYGWSEDGNFKHGYEVPTELYYFMINLVDRNFWSNDNSKLKDKFMKRILAGYDSIETLMWVKGFYGPNSNELIN